VAGEEGVDALADAHGERDDAVDALLAVQHTDEVRQVVEDREIVLDADDVAGREKGGRGNKGRIRWGETGNLESVRRSRTVLAAFSRCLISRYDDGSSIMYLGEEGHYGNGNAEHKKDIGRKRN
jgi:hypothetical protein